MICINLTPKKKENFEKYIKKAKDKRIADRLRIAYLRGKGWSYNQLCEAFGVSYDTVHRILVLFKKRKYKGLRTINYSGRQRRLTPEQEKELKRDLRKSLFGSSKEVVEHVRKKFGIKYTVNHMTKLLKSLGFSFKKTKSVPTKADTKAQKAWIKEYNKRKNALKDDEAIFFVDPTHPTHNNVPDYAWIERGIERQVDANSGRERVNIVGAYSPQGNRVFTLQMCRVNKVAITIFLIRLKEQYPELSKIYVYLDNAPYNKSRLVRKYFKGTNVIIDYIPTYSPNLNLVERLWKFFKKKVIKNKYYETFTLFKSTIDNFFDNIHRYKRELNTLLKDNFRVFQNL